MLTDAAGFTGAVGVTSLTLAFSSFFLAVSATVLIFSSLIAGFNFSAVSLRNSMFPKTLDGSVFSVYLGHGESVYVHTD